MVFAAEPDDLVTCPLDEAHRILKSRMQFHLVRCMKNHTLGTRLRCPWNPLHIVDRFAYEDHYKNKCENMPQACESMLKIEPSRDVASVPVNATNSLLPPPVEDWDAEPEQAAYDPTKNAESKMVLRIPIGLSKAKRKQWRLDERARFQRLEAEGPLKASPRPSTEDPKEPKPLRPPHNINRKPREKSPATMSQATGNSNRQFENANARRKNSISSVDDTFDEIPNLCDSFDTRFSDILTSRRSSVSSQRNNFEIPRAIDKARISSGRNGSSQCPSEVANSVLFDETASAEIPNLVSSIADLPNLVSSIAESDDDSVLEISQRIAELTTEQMRLEEKKLALRQKLSMSGGACVPNLVNYDGNVAHDSTYSVYDGMSNASVSVKEVNPFATKSAKSAANFSVSRNAARPPPRFERGIAADGFPINPSSRSETLSGPIRDSKAQTNPFLVDDASVGNISQLTYTLNASNADSIFGCGDDN